MRGRHSQCVAPRGELEAAPATWAQNTGKHEAIRCTAKGHSASLNTSHAAHSLGHNSGRPEKAFEFVSPSYSNG